MRDQLEARELDPRPELVLYPAGATLFGALPDGTPSTAVLVRLSVPAQGPDRDRPVRRVMGWTRLGWQPAAPRV
jgi:hypothetical protein